MTEFERANHARIDSIVAYLENLRAILLNLRNTATYEVRRDLVLSNINGLCDLARSWKDYVEYVDSRHTEPSPAGNNLSKN